MIGIAMEQAIGRIADRPRIKRLFEGQREQPADRDLRAKAIVLLEPAEVPGGIGPAVDDKLAELRLAGERTRVLPARLDLRSLVRAKSGRTEAGARQTERRNAIEQRVIGRRRRRFGKQRPRLPEIVGERRIARERARSAPDH